MDGSGNTISSGQTITESYDTQGAVTRIVKATGQPVGGYQSYGQCSVTVTVSGLLNGDSCTLDSQCSSGYCDLSNGDPGICATPTPFRATCSVSPATTTVDPTTGEADVIYSASPTGGTGNYTYVWSGSVCPGTNSATGDESISGSETTIDASYRYAGCKRGVARISSGNQTITCQAQVTVTPPPKPAITLTASPNPVQNSGDTATISWSVTGATSCTASGAWGNWSENISGTGSDSEETDPVVSGTPQRYTLTCTGPGGQSSASVIVSVRPPPSCTYTYSDWEPASCTFGSSQTRTYTSSPDGCTGTPGPTTRSCTAGPPSGEPPDLSGGLKDPLGNITLLGFLEKTLRAFINLLIPIIVLFFLITGLMFILARGNPAKLATAKTAFLYTTIGAGVVLGAWALAQLVSNTINAIQG